MENNTQEGTEAYLKEHQKKFEEYSREASKEANKVFRELVRQLILVATVFLSISVFIFNLKSLARIFNICNKHLLMCSWILAGFSIIFGIAQFFIDYYFFVKWSKIDYSIAEGISKGETKDEKSLAKSAEEKIQKEPDQSHIVFVWLQVSFLATSIVLMIIFMVKTLILL